MGLDVANQSKLSGETNKTHFVHHSSGRRKVSPVKSRRTGAERRSWEELRPIEKLEFKAVAAIAGITLFLAIDALALQGTLGAEAQGFFVQMHSQVTQAIDYATSTFDTFVALKNGQITVDQALRAGEQIGQVAFEGTNPVATRPIQPFFVGLFSQLDLGQ